MLSPGLLALGLSLPVGAIGARSAVYPKKTCIDPENRMPRPLRYGFPVFETVDANPNCVPQHKLLEGECKSSTGPDNDCKAYCETSHAWFWGHPRDLGVHSWHNPCQRGDSCGLSASISGPIGESVQVTITDTSGNTSSSTIKNAVNWGNTWTTKHAFDFGLAMKGGLAAGSDFMLQGVPVKASLGIDANMGYKFSTDYTTTRGRSLSMDWDRSVTTSQSYGIQRSRQKSAAYSTGGAWSKEPWAAEYCGSWYAVPLLGMSCGKAAMGQLKKADSKSGNTYCSIFEQGSFDVCTSYGFEHELIPEDPRTRTVFVLRDCEHHQILPGEWQLSEFAYSISNMTDYYLDHISRWGIKNLEPKEQDDRWVFQRQMDQKLFNFTKTIGVDDYNFKYCGKNEYCVQLKLTKDRCYDIPRGWVDQSGGGKSAHVVSATVMPGHCCTLFSRHQCLGQSQRILPGRQVDLKDVEYEGFAHSVICDTSEYCRTEQGDDDGSSLKDDYGP